MVTYYAILSTTLLKALKHNTEYQHRKVSMYN